MLNSGWYLEDFIDYEYQYYRLKAYQKMVERQFFALKLYPYIERTKNLMRESILMLDNIKSYSTKNSDIEIFLHDILHESIEVFSELVKDGQNIFDAVSRNIFFFWIGVRKRYLDELIIISTVKDNPRVYVEKYHDKRILDYNENERLIDMQTIYVEENKYADILVDQIRDKIVRENEEYDTLNFIWANCIISAPYEETVREIIKRKVHNFVSCF